MENMVDESSLQFVIKYLQKGKYLKCQILDD